MKLVLLIVLVSLFVFGVVAVRMEVNRSGVAIGQLQNEVEIKTARNQYLALEAARLESPQVLAAEAARRFGLQRTPPQHIIVLDK